MVSTNWSNSTGNSTNWTGSTLNSTNYKGLREPNMGAIMNSPDYTMNTALLTMNDEKAVTGVIAPSTNWTNI